jgi:hypothetical protein
MANIVKKRMQLSPQVLKESLIVDESENTANYLQSQAPAFSFLEVCHTAQVKRSMTERLYNFKNLSPLSPIIFLEDPKIKEKKTRS